MSDEPLDELDGKTPLEYANTPNIDKLAKKSEIGLCHTIPSGMAPGSDVANLSVLGYDPALYYSGRSALEALSIGVDIKDEDFTLRCNLVSLSQNSVSYEDRTMIDHSSGEISTEEANILINEIKTHMNNEKFQFYTGTSYRHLTIWNRGESLDLTPPHDILGKGIKEYLPTNPLLKEMMIKSYEILNNHPINLERQKKGLNKANSIWFWGLGTKPDLDLFDQKFSKKGAMISAVDLLKGIAVGAGMDVISVKGANGSLNTNYEGKALAACKALLEDGKDFAYIHIEAPDEMSHQGSINNKVKSIEFIDEKVVKLVLDQLSSSQFPFKILVMPDHPTPLRYRTHTSDPVPYMIYDSRRQRNNPWTYNEKEAARSKNIINEGYTIMNKFLEKEN